MDGKQKTLSLDLKCKRRENSIKNKKIAENCFDGDMDLFAEIKRQISNPNDDDVTIDGAASRNIPGKFAEVYNKLYNRATDEEKVQEIRSRIQTDINESEVNEVDKINSFTIKERIEKIMANKSDPIQTFSLDFLKNAPDILYDYPA